jgi:dihydroxy-acid dehydratase
MSDAWRSKKVWSSPAAACGRTTFKAFGLTDEDFQRPIIGIANTFMEMGPAHFHLRHVADVVKAGVWQGGGTPLEFNSLAQCPNQVEGKHGIRYDTPTRDILAASIEACTELHMFDALVMIGTCDKIIPGFLLAAARLNLPTIIVPGGPMAPGKFRGEYVMSDRLFTEGYAYEMGVSPLTLEELREMENCACPGAGACAVLGTANTGQCLAEALGLALPGAGTAPATSSARLWHAKNSGRQIVKLVMEGIRARDIVTESAILNAIKVLHALGGSTNSVIHLLALVNELDLNDKIDVKTFDRLSQEIPCLTPIQPCGPFTIADFDEAGGIHGLMKELGSRLDLDVMTVTGRTLGQNLDKVSVKRTEVIRPFSDPVYKGGLAVLSGNLATSAIARPTVIVKEMLAHKGPARVFDSMEEADEGIRNGKVKPGDIVVVRYEGPRGGPGLTDLLSVVSNLKAKGLYTSCCVVSDGKVSGFGQGPYICQVSPEAATGGPLAIVRDDDLIEYDIAARKLNLMVDSAEIQQRLKSWKRPACRVKRGFLTLYAKLADPVEIGGGLNLKL